MRVLILAALLGLSACATAESGPPAGRDCFRADDVHGYSLIDDHTVRVNLGANRGYLLGIPQNARELDWTQQIALRSDNGWICTGNGLGVELIGGQFSRRYQVRSVSPAPAEGS